MTQWAYYNEFEPYAAQWLRNLIAKGLIADGYVDERDIRDVEPDDLRDFGQCHFFAGIGGWSLALRRAGVDDGEPVWTGSCPCQPFSAAGKGLGFDDERHLWPTFHWLIAQRRPHLVFGEQVSSPDGRRWLDLVQTDMEGLGYACGALVAPAAGVGAPHARHRTYWCAVANTASGLAGHRDLQRSGQLGLQPQGRSAGEGSGGADGLADADGRQCDGFAGRQGRERDGQAAGWVEGHGGAERGGETGAMDDSVSFGRNARRLGDHRGDVGVVVDADEQAGVALGDASREGLERRSVPERERVDELSARAPSDLGDELEYAESDGRNEGRQGAGTQLRQSGGGGDGTFWTECDWLYHRDGFYRPVEPGTFPLVDGAAARVGKLRAYGNAIVAPKAEAFIRAALEAIHAS